MLPVIPFDILLPLAIGATALCLALILVILGRRAFVKWWSRGGERLTDEIEQLLEDAYEGRSSAKDVADWIGNTPPVRIQSLVKGVRRVAARNDDIHGWIRSETQVGERLGRIFGNTNAGRRARWTRIAAAQAIGELGLESEIPELVDGLSDTDPEVAYAAGSALSRLNKPEGADALLDHIRVDSHLSNSRLASFLETMECELAAVFEKHLQREDSQARYWTVTLIGQRANLPEMVEDIRPLLESPDANVRAATCECIGELGVPLTDRWLAPLVHDEAWFVQSHAAKSLGMFKAVWAVPELVELLYSPEWWVRQNSAQALGNIGREAAEEVEKVLVSEDRFARNTAVEILERIGWVDEMVRRAAGGVPGAADFLQQFGLWGGLGYLENALFTCDEDGALVLLEILRELGDDATYGRIRAAAEEMPEHLRPHARAIAAEVQGR